MNKIRIELDVLTACFCGLVYFIVQFLSVQPT